MLHESLVKTLKVTVMILTILMAGNMFAGVFIAGGGVQTTEQLIAEANLGPWLTLGAVPVHVLPRRLHPRLDLDPADLHPGVHAAS